MSDGECVEVTELKERECQTEGGRREGVSECGSEGEGVSECRTELK